MDPKFKFSVLGGTLLAHLGEVQSYGHNALSAAPRLSTFEWLGRKSGGFYLSRTEKERLQFIMFSPKIWWFHPNIFMFFWDDMG